MSFELKTLVLLCLTLSAVLAAIPWILIRLHGRRKR